jgi:glutamate/tyrosine decarboxylase-like PLP-dependent enzyme
MKKRVVFGVGILLVMTVTWAAFGQAQGERQGRGGFGRMSEAQQKALAALQEQVAKLKAMMDRSQGAQARSFQDMSEEERTKMRDESTKRREEQAQIMASMQQSLDTLKGGRQLMQEHEESIAPLKDLLAAAQAEKAKDTAGKIETLIAQRQKQFEDKITAMGMTMEQLQRSGQRRQQQ